MRVAVQLIASGLVVVSGAVFVGCGDESDDEPPREWDTDGEWFHYRTPEGALIYCFAPNGATSPPVSCTFVPIG
jgi:hypothetical protein